MPPTAQVPGHRNAAPRPTPGKPPPGTYPAGFTSAARVQSRGCKGRSPLHKKTKNSPFPGGEGGRGDRGKKALLRQANPATGKASPTPGAVSATSTDNQPGKPPPGTYPAGLTSAARIQPRGCKGQSPLHKKTKNSPLPLRGRGLGGWGQKGTATAGKSGNRKSQPPADAATALFPNAAPGSSAGVPERRPRPAPGKPPPGTYPAGLTSAARVQPRGCKGRSPLHKKTRAC